jgi:alpha-tubulin suppressor-like RCC1 family protein
MIAAAAVFASALAGSSMGGSSSGEVSAGAGHTCLLRAGAATCWGLNFSGQLGDGTTTDRLSPVAVSGLPSGVKEIAAGALHTCALLVSGGVECWGSNYSGQLGDGTTTERHSPVTVSGLSTGVRAITAGGEHTCALLDGGGIECWGDNREGELGDGTKTSRNSPVAVSGLSSGVKAIAAGVDDTCAVLSTGAARCWGGNADGEIGDGTQVSRATPVPVANLRSGVVAIAPGSDHTCALLNSGGVECWGDNLAGALGDGTEDDHYTPAPVLGLSSGVQAIASGGEYLGFTCAIVADGTVKCWGYNEEGELGDGTAAESRSKPVTVVAPTGGARTIAAGAEHACALLASGDVSCWGQNHDGQLGNGTRTRELTLRVVGGGKVSGAPGLRHCHQPFGEPLECTLSRTQGTKIALVARAAKTWRFKTWKGACKGKAARCTFVLAKDVTVSAYFTKGKR